MKYDQPNRVSAEENQVRMFQDDPGPPNWRAEWPAPPAGRRPGMRRRASLRPATVRLGGWRPDVRTLALVLGVLAALGLLGATLSFAVDLFAAPWRLLTADIEESLHLVASAIGLGGALELYRRGRAGKPLILVSLGINLAATLSCSRGTLARLETFAPFTAWLRLGGLVRVVRTRPADDGRLDTTSTLGGP